MKFPNSEHALIPPEKISGYLLSPDHPTGKFKAAFFHSQGYSQVHWKRLENDIRSILENDAIYGERTEYGQKFEVKGKITGPVGKPFLLVTVWIILNGEDVPRFITAFPGEKK
ncbi:MAG: hypothetical protein NTX45_09035 [Proteobacteria bacterium]|nr:hypothetical protein [Pseudomonadota bacterium]